MSNLLELARQLAEGHDDVSGASSLARLLAEIAAGVDLDLRGGDGLRAVDILARGSDTLEAGAAIEAMAETDFAAHMIIAPGSGETSPMMMACYRGNAAIVEKFLELGMPADRTETCPKLKILAGTAFHAVVLGYKPVEADRYIRCMGLLLAYCPDGINIADRLRQTPVDLAVKTASSTGDRSLADAIVAFGAELSNNNGLDARSLIQVMMKAAKHADLATVVSHGAANRALLTIDREERAAAARAARP